jgi:hypothetical protein
LVAFHGASGKCFNPHDSNSGGAAALWGVDEYFTLQTTIDILIRMKIATLSCYGFCVAAGAFLAYYELHSDDTGLEVLLILAFTFILGCWHPRHAWQWALLVGPWAPAADLFGKAQHSLHGSLASVAAVVVVIGLVGSYLGALLRKGISTAVTHAG